MIMQCSIASWNDNISYTSWMLKPKKRLSNTFFWHSSVPRVCVNKKSFWEEIKFFVYVVAFRKKTEWKTNVSDCSGKWKINLFILNYEKTNNFKLFKQSFVYKRNDFFQQFLNNIVFYFERNDIFLPKEQEKERNRWKMNNNLEVKQISFWTTDKKQTKWVIFRNNEKLKCKKRRTRISLPMTRNFFISR